jgi:hypothetical protein
MIFSFDRSPPLSFGVKLTLVEAKGLYRLKKNPNKGKSVGVQNDYAAIVADITPPRLPTQSQLQVIGRRLAARSSDSNGEFAI